jgi:crotonobetainyl-CoA:carnitine CoA-transferase CaiB-like acyl-CoA transferase
LPVVGNPVQMSGCNTTAHRAPPMLGDSTGDVLSDVLGLAKDDIDGLRRAGVIG